MVMGHQITFHMLEEDKREFFRFLESHHKVSAAPWTSQNGAIALCNSPVEMAGELALWEPHRGFRHERKKIVREDGSVAYDFDRQNPVLEFSPSSLVKHGEAPALLQGRLYSFNSELSLETSGLFRTARYWIRKSFEPCPVKLLKGYIGPSAMRWYRGGGIILPMFNPPATRAWEEFIQDQHRT
jgi:hypothetical protein